MESPVVVDKPPEYGNTGNNERGFPFDEDEATGVWSELEARHPDIAARLRQRPTTWERKRRPSSRDADDFGDSFGGFNRFPFGDIPSEFREHFPSHFNRRYSSRDESQPQQQSPPQSPPQQTTSTQTENPPTDSPTLTQYGLRNTVDLGQKSAVDPSVDADDRNHRCMSAPPDSRTPIPKMSGQNHQGSPPQQPEQHSNVRIIPITVEGRDSPVINKSVDHGTHYGETKPSFESTHSYFDDNPPYYNAPQNFGKSCGGPSFYKAGPQPFVQQKVYPQNAGVFTRGASPHRSQSPRSQPHEEYVKVPVHHEQSAPKPEPHRPQQTAPQPQPPKPPQQPQPPQQPTQQPPPPNPPTPPQEPKSQSSANDPINQILAVQSEVLNLMNEVENFTGTKKDKRYIFLDEMLTRNLIKLDNIETDGKEIIRTARKKAVKCIEKCIAVLEVKAEKGSAAAREAEMNAEQKPQNNTVENGEGEVNTPKETNVEPQPESTEKGDPKLKEQKENVEVETLENKEAQPQAPDTRPEQSASVNTENQEPKEEEPKNEDSKTQELPATGDKVDVSKKGAKNVKRDKSKEKPAKDSKDKEIKDKQSLEPMQVDDKGDKPDSQGMEVDGTASQ